MPWKEIYPINRMDGNSCLLGQLLRSLQGRRRCFFQPIFYHQEEIVFLQKRLNQPIEERLIPSIKVLSLFSTRYLDGLSPWSQFKQKWQLFTLVYSHIYTFSPHVSVYFPLVPTCLHNDADQVDRRRPEGHFAMYTSALPE